ncbi:MAG: hypothetical protein HC880_12820 [Bacteroidia bacterium]|nr:hypothetical protein [Bacteroidia bacterium]
MLRKILANLRTEDILTTLRLSYPIVVAQVGLVLMGGYRYPDGWRHWSRGAGRFRPGQ